MNSRRLLIGGFITLASAAQAQVDTPLEVTVTTNRPSYRRGEALDALVTVQNPSDQAIRLNFPTYDQADVRYDDSLEINYRPFPAETHVDVPARGSYTWTRIFPWSHFDLPIGRHSVVGLVNQPPRWTSAPAFFDVVPTVLPADSFLVDFETVPGETTRVRELNQYWPFGVHFRSIGAPGPSIQPDHFDPRFPPSTTNHYLDIGQATYPLGFNIVADFDMPVFGATVDVSAGAGVTITMTAKDAEGKIIGQVTSEPVPNYPDFSRSLTFQSDRPIASIEWFPSQRNSSVLLDNLYIIIPEPSATCVAALGLGMSLLRRPRRKLEHHSAAPRSFT